MKSGKIFKIIRGVLMTCIVLAVILPALLYVALSLPWVHDAIRHKCESVLTEKLGADVTIDDLGIRPFNRATIRGVTVVNAGDTIMTAERLGAGISVYELLLHGNIAIDYAEVSGLDLRLHRDSPDSPLNIQPVIDALSGKDKDKAPAKFDLRINTVVIRTSTVSYDVTSVPRRQPGVFDPSHIKILNLRADLNIPRLSNDDSRINLRRLAFAEQSGLEITGMKADFRYSPEEIGWKNLTIEMPGSKIEPLDMSESLSSLGGIATGLSGRMLSLGFKPGSHIQLSDIAPLAPELDGFDATVAFDMEIDAGPQRIILNSVNISDNTGQLTLTLRDGIIDNPLDSRKLHYKVDDLSLHVGGKIYNMLAASRLPALKNIALPHGLTLKGNAEGNAVSGRAKADATVDNGTIAMQMAYSRPDEHTPLSAKFNVTAKNIDLREATGVDGIGRLNGNFKGEATIAGKRSKARLDATVADFTYRGHTYGRIAATAAYNAGTFDGNASLDDAAGKIDLAFNGSIVPGKECLSATATLADVSPHGLNISDSFNDYIVNARIEANLRGALPDRADGSIHIAGLDIASPQHDKKLTFDSITLISRASELPRRLEIESDIINGGITGDFRFTTLVPALRDIAIEALPTLADSPASLKGRSAADIAGNDFDFSFTLDNLDRISDFFNLPVYAIYPVDIDGNIDAASSQASINIDAPYLRQGNRLIEGTQLTAFVDGAEGIDRAVLNTSFPSKDGMTAVTLAMQAKANVVDTDIKWKIDRKRDYSGAVAMSTLIDRHDGMLSTYTDIHRSTMTFNDSVWIVSPALIVTEGTSDIRISDFNISRSNQFVKIDGTISNDPDDTVDIDVLNLNLDYIFEAIGIDKVMLGGDATGVLTASHLLSGSPRLSTDGIHVTDISYNRCVLGDADVLSRWDNDLKAVAIDGTIHQHNGKTAKVEGEIFPLSSSLDIRLRPDETPVGFMGEYMKAFASDISGLGSGSARIYGTFSDIDMEGDLYVKDLRLKLDFTNTYFTASDSIKITPGKITLSDVTLSDPYGHTATLNGTVCHEFFRNPTFDFAITDARGMLVYDESPKQNADWYGRIFVNGGATIKGKPGVVNIDVEATTTAGSTFSFVLSELEIADEYTFLTFRDKNATATVEEVTVDERLGAVEHLRALLNKPPDEESSDYIIELRVNITPEAEVILVMDPVGGDRIRSHGQGNMRMVYTSADNDLRMFGTYTLDRGTYNFTLQDIIIKDFIINSGSQIAFTGDPLTARLNIEAIYPLNANLSDLDESFLQDKELNRTNVPVHAVLKVRGDIQQPEISFDLAFPTLTSDTYRKVRSIVSTEEMMNRQIIYLLALNRFYTPDYMASTTKGSELFSVASSTISSQLSNILGHLSDNWSVSPNFRSDRGDFSDMEVDVALSSRLLNNRLLLNGNFGYRDNMMNSNQFIGDFQIEYLLNRSGTIRLKAYNVYNDQNYYLRTADTTQGVGVMFKKDFDNIFSFLRPWLRKAAATAVESNDSTGHTAPAVSDRTPFIPEAPADSTRQQPDSTATALLRFNEKKQSTANPSNNNSK